MVFGKYDLGERGTNDFISTKGNIYWADAFSSQHNSNIHVVANAKNALRMEVVENKSNWIDNSNRVIKYGGKWEESECKYIYF